MLIMEVITGDKPGFSLLDGLIREVVVLDTETNNIHHWVNTDYLQAYLLETDPRRTDEDIEALTLSSLVHTRSLDLEGKTYMESWSRHTLEEMTDKLGELLGDKGRLS